MNISVHKQLKEDCQYIQNFQQTKQTTPQDQSIAFNKYFQLLNQSISTNKSQLIKLLQENKVAYSEDTFYKDIHCKLVANTFNYEASSIVVYYGYFSTQISILNVQSPTPTVKIRFVGKGKYGQVYNYQNQDSQNVIKIAHIQDGKIQFKHVLQQYFISLIASILDIGPKITDIYGFNLIFYRRTLQYSMKLCQNRISNYKLHFEDLKQALLKLHLLNIIHSDIKPQNIAFDENRQSLVFLDYGLSKIIEEGIGKKTLVSAFSGTYDYCGQQMKNIFLLQRPSYIDLYQNDVFGLFQSIKNIQQKVKQGCINDNELQQSNYQSCIQDLIIQQNIIIFELGLKRIRNQYLLFQSAISNLVFQSEIQKQFFSFVSKFPNCFNFIKNLPIFLVRNSKIVINISKINQRSINKHSIFINPSSLKDDYGWQNEDFKKRIKSLQYFDTIQLCQYLNKNDKQFCLFHPKVINLLNQQKCNLLFAKFIKINGLAKSKSHIIRVCQNIPSLFQQQQYKTMDYEHIYFASITFLLQFCIKSSFRDKAYQILQNILQTAIILQIIPSQSLKSLFAKIIESQGSFFKKIRLCFLTISYLQYIRHKYKSTYNYNQLKQSLIQVLIVYLNVYNPEIQKQLLLSQAISLTLSYKTNSTLLYQLIIGRANNLSNLTFDQRNFLLNQLFAYVSYCEAMMNFSNSIAQQIQQESLILKVVLKNLKHHKFSYHSCLLFMHNHNRNINSQSQKIYQTFIKQIGHFKQHKSFKIRIFYQLKNILNHGNGLPLNLNQKMKKNQSQFFVQILQISNAVIQNKINFNQLVQQIFLLKNINNKKEQYRSLLCKIISQNKQQIISFSDSYLLSQDIMHQNKFLHQIKNIQLMLHHGIVNKMFTQQQQQNLYALYYKTIKYRLLQMECFECKLLSLIEINITFFHKYFLYKPSSSQNYQTSMSVMIDLLIFCFKNPQLRNTQMRVMVNILSLTQIYKGSIQHWMNLRQNHIDVLALESLRKLFVLIYTFIQRQYCHQSLIDFIFSIGSQLHASQSFVLVNNFYKNIIHMIEQSKLQFNQQFHKYHHMIINLMIKRQYNPYVNVYYFSLLQCNIKYPITRHILSKVANQMHFFDVYTKYLILSKYYQYFNFYFNIPSKRKLIYLKKMIQKYKETISTNKKLLTFIKIKRSTSSNSQLHHNKLINCLKKYYIEYKQQK